jgi:uncharacterized protein (TIGR02421 family)
VTAKVSAEYTGALRELSDRLVDAQRPIRILDAVNWNDSVRKAFFAADCREPPRVDRDYYQSRPLGFDPRAKRQELHALERDIIRRLGQYNSVSQIMRRMCREYATVVRMLEARGTPEFALLSQELYGSASDVFHAGDPTVADLGVMMSAALDNIDQSRFLPEQPRNIGGEQAVQLLKASLDRSFPESDLSVQVKLSDGIVADAAAGSDYIKLRQDAMFNQRDLRILEVHEGWVHIGTNLNGSAQPYCTFLSKAPPSATVTQEGLALLTEVFSFCSHPERLRRVTNRIRAVDLAEQGAGFLEVFEHFRSRGTSAEESYAIVSRVFRGSTPDGGPFSKDLAYSKGFVQIYNYIRLAVRKGMLERIQLLFCGKLQLEDARVIAQLVEEGIVARPRYLPPPFADLNALAAWMCYSNFLNQLSIGQMEADYHSLL